MPPARLRQQGVRRAVGGNANEFRMVRSRAKQPISPAGPVLSGARVRVSAKHWTVSKVTSRNRKNPLITAELPAYTRRVARVRASTRRRFEMADSRNPMKGATALAVALSCIALSSLGGADGMAGNKRGNVADQELFFAPVPKAVCGPGDKPEQALQGQVTAAQRAAGYQGNSCNLQLLAQVKGEGAN